MNRYLLKILLTTFLFMPTIVFAHPGGLDSKGCHYCRTNCAKWGLEQNEYHCHSGNTYSNSKGQTFNKDGVKISDPVTNNTEPEPQPEPSPTPEPKPAPPVSNDVPSNNNSNQNNNASSNTNNNTKPSTNSGNSSSSNNNTSTSANKPSTNTSVEKEDEKTEENEKKEKISNDASIKSLKVNGKDVDVSDNMFTETTKKTLVLNVTTKSNKANVNYDKKELIMGENEIIIKVTAEDGTEKEYKLIVKRVKGQGTATFVELTIGTYDIEFDNYKASILLTKGETLNSISYKLSDEKATVKLYLNDNEVNDIKNLKGDNILTLVTIDEDNNKLTYEVEINEMGLIGTILFYILIIVILVGSITWCVFVFKFIKKKIKK